jgi:ornithine carbamoyltransferase
LAVALLRLGVNVTVGAPTGYQLSEGGPEDPRGLKDVGTLRLSDSPTEAVRKADVIYTDAWVSMGMEAETDQRRRELSAFRVDEKLLALAKNERCYCTAYPRIVATRSRTRYSIAPNHSCGAKCFTVVQR